LYLSHTSTEHSRTKLFFICLFAFLFTFYLFIIYLFGATIYLIYPLPRPRITPNPLDFDWVYDNIGSNNDKEYVGSFRQSHEIFGVDLLTFLSLYPSHRQTLLNRTINGQGFNH
jgi:hypothetical protein